MLEPALPAILLFDPLKFAGKTGSHSSRSSRSKAGPKLILIMVPA
jgi:hypothetical protein